MGYENEDTPFDRLWLRLAEARNHVDDPAGEREFDVWASEEPAVRAAWEAITHPDNLALLEARVALDLNPVARESAEQALRECRERCDTLAQDFFYDVDWDFCWFARDSAGRYAAFTTGGNGPVPVQVRPHMDRHNDVECVLDAPSTKSANWWQSYVDRGLFVFDWETSSARPRLALKSFLKGFLGRGSKAEAVGRYRRLGAPSAGMPDRIAEMLAALPGVFLCEGEFSAVPMLDVGRLRSIGRPAE